MRGRGVVGRRLLQAAVGVLALVPILAGLGGMISGVGLTGGSVVDLAGRATDSQYRYLSGLLFAIGVGFWSTVPDLPRQTRRFRLLTALVVVGGLGRLLGVIEHGAPPGPMLFGLGMELVVTPSLCLLQALIAQPD